MVPLICFCFDSQSQPGRLNAGLNLQFNFLPKITSTNYDVFNYDGYNANDFILNTPISLRYYSKSLVGFQYKAEYRKESYTLNTKPFQDRIVSSCKFFVNSLALLIKLNRAKYSNTSLSFGLQYFHGFSQDYSYTQRPDKGDSVYVYSSNKIQHLKTELRIAISRETRIKESSLTFYWELFFRTPIYTKSYEVPVFYSNEFGFMLGLAYNFGSKNRPVSEKIK